MFVCIKWKKNVWHTVCYYMIKYLRSELNSSLDWKCHRGFVPPTQWHILLSSVEINLYWTGEKNNDLNSHLPDNEHSDKIRQQYQYKYHTIVGVTMESQFNIYCMWSVHGKHYSTWNMKTGFFCRRKGERSPGSEHLCNSLNENDFKVCARTCERVFDRADSL